MAEGSLENPAPALGPRSSGAAGSLSPADPYPPSDLRPAALVDLSDLQPVRPAGRHYVGLILISIGAVGLAAVLTPRLHALSWIDAGSPAAGPPAPNLIEPEAQPFVLGGAVLLVLLGSLSGLAPGRRLGIRQWGGLILVTAGATTFSLVYARELGSWLGVETARTIDLLLHRLLTDELGFWVRAGGPALLLAGGLLLAPELLNTLCFLVSALLHLLMAVCVQLLFQLEPRWSITIAGSLVLGYMFNMVRAASPLSGRGAVGLCLSLLAALCLRFELLDWRQLTWVPQSAGFFQAWQHELTWAVVLICAALGMAMSRSRWIHFLNAALLIALACYCVQSGSVRVESASHPVANGVATVTYEHVSLAHVPMWRWMAAAELTLSGAVMLYLGVGIGGIAVAVALAWMFFGLAIYQQLGTLSLVKTSTALLAQATNAHPLNNLGFPVPLSAPVSSPVRPGMPPQTFPAAPSSSPGIAPPVSITTAPALPLVQPSVPFSVGRNDPVSDEQLLEARRQAQESLRAAQAEFEWQARIREALPHVWMALTAVLAGLIAASGLRMLVREPAERRWVALSLWLCMGAGLASLWWLQPFDAADPLGWLMKWALSAHRVEGMWVLCLASTALVGAWALLGDGTDHTWLMTGATAALLGTLISLLAMTIAIRFGGYPQLPTWVYILVSLAQSSLTLVLLTYASRPRLEV